MEITQRGLLGHWPFYEFQTYDSASTMSGKERGAQQMVRITGIEDFLYSMLPNGISLVTEHASKASILILKMHSSLESAYVFFLASSKQQEILSKNWKLLLVQCS